MGHFSAIKIDARKYFFSELIQENTIGQSSAQRRRNNLAILFNNTTLVPFKWLGSYKCFFCGLKCPNYSDLTVHTESHLPCTVKVKALKRQKCGPIEVKFDISRIICKLCKDPFGNMKGVIKHLIGHHGLNYVNDVPMNLTSYRLVDLKCLKCETTCESYISLNRHMNKIHPSKDIPCTKCEVVFKRRFDLREHLRVVHQISGLKCPVCKVSFQKFNDLQEHLAQMKCSQKSAAKTSNFTSNYVDLEIESAQEFAKVKQSVLFQERKRIARKNRENIACILNMTTAIPFKFYRNNFRCFYCLKEMNGHKSLEAHTLEVHPYFNIDDKCPSYLKGVDIYLKLDISKLACKVCSQTFDDLNAIVDHLIDEHDAKYDKGITGIMQGFKLEEYNMVCPICAQKYTYFSQLLAHLNQKHMPKNNLCEDCGDRFPSKNVLDMHIKRHHGVLLKCEECDVEIKGKMQMMNHKAKQHGIKQVACRYCQEKFVTHYEMMKHLIAAHNVGHKCSQCDRVFVKDSFKRNHIRRVHMREKNVECTVCGLKFFDNTRLKMHLVTHSGQKNFHCNICGRSFYLKSKLKAHQAKPHKH